MLVSEDSSTCIGLLAIGNSILRGTKTVVAAGTLVVFGFVWDSSGLLLDLLAELGSLGGVIPEAMTQTTQNFYRLWQRSRSNASLAQRPKKDQKRTIRCKL